MKRIVRNITIAMALTCCILFILGNTVQARPAGEGDDPMPFPDPPSTSKPESTTVDSFDEMKDKAEGFINAGKDKGEELVSSDKIQSVVRPIARILVTIATVVVTIVTIVMGIKYMMAPPDQQAKLKQQLFGLIVSTVVIYGAQAIWALLYDFMTNMTK